MARQPSKHLRFRIRWPQSSLLTLSLVVLLSSLPLIHSKPHTSPGQMRGSSSSSSSGRGVYGYGNSNSKGNGKSATGSNPSSISMSSSQQKPSQQQPGVQDKGSGNGNGNINGNDDPGNPNPRGSQGQGNSSGQQSSWWDEGNSQSPSPSPTMGDASSPSPTPSLSPSPSPSPAVSDGVRVNSTQWFFLSACASFWHEEGPLSTWSPDIPCTRLPGVTCDDQGSVMALNLSGWGLGRSIPSFIAGLPSLEEIDLSGNQLSGSVPRSFRQLTRLRVINLSDNYLSSQLPDIFSSFVNLTSLSLGTNAFTGAIPSSIFDCNALTLLDLSNNGFSRSISQAIGLLSNLVHLLLFGNALTGTIPQTIGWLSLLQTLDLSNNLLNGQVPPSLSTLDALSHLDFSSNQLSGPLPSNFTSPLLSSPSGFVSVTSNYFTGSATVTAADSPFCPSAQQSDTPVFDLKGAVTTPALLQNCLSYTATSACISPFVEVQRTELACMGFCGAMNPEGPCGGHGRCFLKGGSAVPACICRQGFTLSQANTTLSEVTISYPTCSQDNDTVPSTPEDGHRGSFKTGLQPSLPGGSSFNPHFRYASLGFFGTSDNPQWRHLAAVDWTNVDNQSFVGEVRDQGRCNACWAISALDAAESAYAIVTGNPLPELSVQEIIDCAAGNCSVGGYPGEAFQLIASLPATSNFSLASEADYPFDPTTADSQCQSVAGSVPLRLTFEAVRLYGWLGIVLAVQQQPVVVSIAADSASFRNYSGGYVYNDPSCFSSGILNHNLLVVGYNTLAPEPYWLLRNSWGPAWGDGGYMQMAIMARDDTTGVVAVKSGEGVCGIYTMPALYPVIKGLHPCYPINPCGGGHCRATRAAGLLNTCHCNEGFVAVTNIDGSQTCSPVAVCSLDQNSPCWVGTCVDDGRGGYGCVCPDGFTLGQDAYGGTTCVPDEVAFNTTTYAVHSATTTCYHLELAFGLSRQQFAENNPPLSCDSETPLSVGTIVNVTNPDGDPCSLPYTVSLGDQCGTIAFMFNLTVSQLVTLNPALNCSNLFVGLQVCVQRGDPYQFPLCTSYHGVSDGDTCSSIMASQHPPLTPSQFFSLNPGLLCNNLVPTPTGDGLGGTEVCVAANTFGISCPFKSYVVRRGDSCSVIYAKYFYLRAVAQHISAPELYYRLNKSYCSRIWIGYIICLPYGVSP